MQKTIGAGTGGGGRGARHRGLVVAMAAVEDVAAAGRADPAPPTVVLAPATAREQEAEAIESPRATEEKKNNSSTDPKPILAKPRRASASCSMGGRGGAAWRRSEEQSRSGQVRSGREEGLPRPRSWAAVVAEYFYTPAKVEGLPA